MLHTKAGDINDLLPLSVNNELKSFIRCVVDEAFQVPPSHLVVVAPEYKKITRAPINNDFKLADENIYVIGSATGKFRGILQSYCSGKICAERINNRVNDVPF